MRRGRAFAPFASRGRRATAAILLVFALFSVVSVALSIRATTRSQNKAAVVEAAARQRTLAERYVNDVLLARDGARVDPARTASLLGRSALALLNGGTAPAVPGDDDAIKLSPASGLLVRAQLKQERRLVSDLTRTGSALLAGRPATDVPLTADEHPRVSDPITRLRILTALTSNVSLNAARTFANQADQNINGLITTQILLGIAGLLTSLALGLALIAAARRQTTHFRSLVTASTDLVLVFGGGGCRYASQSVAAMVGHPDAELLGDGFLGFVHSDDLPQVREACDYGVPRELGFRVRNHFGEWRHLDAHVTDLRNDRHVRGVVLNARDNTERVRLEEELTRQAFHDGLTGLPNRALFRDRLDQAVARSLRSNDVLAVLVLDLDGFKQANDSLGHDAGDELLRQVAERLAEITRPSDTLARIGGDEFALLLDGSKQAQAVNLTRRLLDRLSTPLTIANHELSVGASVGIAIHSGGEGDSEELIRNADVAMYAAKEAGRGRYEVFHYDMARQFGEMLGLEHELRLGLERGEFEVHYQPEVDLDSTRIVGVEALLRWDSPTLGSVPPTRFIPVAEATGLIFALGEFVLHEACAQTAKWRKQGLVEDPFVTWVNVSGVQLSAGGVGDLVQASLASTGLPATYLGLEVTETAVVEGVPGDRARADLKELHDQGVRIAIDDFGTGFSSLGQLRHFPIDMLKVDRSFVQGVEHDAKDAAITANLVNLAHALGVTAIAEGIESDGQLREMRAVGCDLAQGYLFARPASADQVTGILAGAAAELQGGTEEAGVEGKPSPSSTAR
jgi:diguanylate cyclase (GGDEF)-like protein/PAS domain S-box-containing protein